MSNCNPVIVEVHRGGVLESFHRGVICVVDENGNVLYSEGNTEQVCFPRSALKFFQHLPLLLSGAFEHFGFTLEELAIMCGSHNGEPEHVKLVESIFQKIGLKSELLQCGAQPPTLKKDVNRLVLEGKEPTALHNNCSGKHAGFLAWCVFNKVPTDDYISPSHPLHIEIKKYTALFHEIEIDELKIGIDGCSAPIFAMPVINQAKAYKNLVYPVKFSKEVQLACKMIVDSVTTFPFMVAGTKRYCSDLMKVSGHKLVGKTGADGIYSIGIPDRKIGITIKIDDGKMGPQYNVAQQLLRNSGVFSANESEQLDHYMKNEITNYAGKVTGSISVCNNIALKF